MTEPEFPPLDFADFADFAGEQAVAFLAPPKPGDDKYSRGVLGIMTGSARFPGAAVLGVEGATRAGVGMVRYLGPGRATRLVLQRRPEVVTAAGRVQASLLGSGMDSATREASVTAALIEVLQQGHPVVVDAGALDLLEHATGPVVITPHAGELLTLLTARDVATTRAAIEAAPAHWATVAANLLGVTVLLKGHVTHVVSASNDPAPAATHWSTGSLGAAPRGVAFRITAPTTELATAGSGDVLAGILGALVATHHELMNTQPEVLAELAATAAVLHGLAGERASGGGPIVALDIAEAIPATIAALRASV